MSELIKEWVKNSGWQLVYIAAGLMFIFTLINLGRIYFSKNNENSKLSRNSNIKLIIFLSSVLFVFILIFIVVRHFSFYFKGEEYETYQLLNEYVSAVAFGIIFFLTVLFLIQDIIIFIFFIIRKIKELKGGAGDNFLRVRKIVLNPLFVITFSFILSFLSLISPTIIEETNYEVSFKNKNAKVEELNICFISDIHLGVSIKKNELLKIAKILKEKKPDMLILGGDIFDEGTTYKEKIFFQDIFKKLNFKYGKYFVQGNHDEYKERHSIRTSYENSELTEEEFLYSLKYNDATLPFMNRAGITPLVDDFDIISDTAMFFGLDDYNNFETKEDDKKITEKINLENKDNLPVILLSHQPKCEDIRKNINAPFIQLSGHTHNGQLLPFNFVNIIDNSSYQYGYYKKNGIIVSSGVGTYGVPLRLLTKSEIVFLKVKFK